MSNQAKATATDLQTRRAAVAANLARAELNARVLPIARLIQNARRLAAELKTIEASLLAVVTVAFGF